MRAALAGRQMGKTARALVEHACRAAARMPRAPSAAGGRAGLAGDRRLACPSTLGAVQLRSVMVSSSVKERGMSGMVGSGVTGGPAGPGEAAGAPRSDKFFDVTGANFAQVVNDSTVPVIIVCYAPEEGGVSDTVRRKFEAQVSSVPGVMLGRLDVEQQQELAMNLQLAEIPTVFAINNKKVVNKISGNLNDTEIAGFVANCSHLARLAAGEGQVQEAAELLTQGHVAEALEVYGAILKNGKEHSDVVRASALAGMGMCAVSLNDLEGAKGIATLLRAEYKLLLEEPVVKQALTAVDMALAAEDCGDEGDLRKALEADAADHDTRHKLAILLLSKGDAKGAMNQALEIMKRDRKWNEDGGRKLLLQFFDSLGSQHPDVVEARKRLSALLFV